MPHTSPAKRKLRRLKRANALGNKAAIRFHGQALKNFQMLMTVLAQKGGEVTVTKGTIAQVMGKLQFLDFAVIKGATDGELIIRMLDRSPADVAHFDTPADTGTAPATPSLVISHPTDNDGEGEDARVA
jgi:hypothetical protein